MRDRSNSLKPFIAGIFFLLGFVANSSAQKLLSPTHIWSVGPLTKSDPVMGVAFGSQGATFTGPRIDSQTGSIFAATRSVFFAGGRIVLVSRIGLRNVTGATVPQEIIQLLSLDVQTGVVKDSREFTGFGPRAIFATSDGRIILSGSSVLKLTPELKDDGRFDLISTGHKFASVENISPDGSTLGIKTSPGYQMLSTATLQAINLTSGPSVDTSINNHGFATDNVHWVNEYPKDRSFLTYTDTKGDRLIYHGKCGGRPQFLTDKLVLEPGCKSPFIVDTHGNLIHTLSTKGAFSYAGVSQNGKRFALQIGKYSGMHDLKQEHFVIYSIDTWEPVTEVIPEEHAEGQSWTAFSPDGSMFVVGSPLKLTLYRLP